MAQPSAVNQWQFVRDGQVRTFTPPYESVLHWIDYYSQKHPDKEAIVGVGEPGKDAVSVSYAELAQALRRSCGYFRDTLALAPGDAISALVENKPELLAMSWAAWSNDLKTVPLDSKRDSLERKLYKLRLTETKVLFVRTDQADAQEIGQLRSELPDMRIIEFGGDRGYFELVSESPEVTGASDIASGARGEGTYHDRDCLILFTSGTTALPKGARLTLRSLWANAQQIVHWLRITEGDRFHILLPLHHINSTTFSLAAILAGGTIVLSPRYSKSRFWEIMARYGATLASIVPTIAYDLLSEEDAFEKHKDKLEQVSRIQIGSAPVQVSVVTRFYSRYKIRLIQGYGSTETSLRCAGVPCGLEEKDYLKIVQTNSIGTEMLYNDVAILKKDHREAGEGEEGEICIRGPIVTRGYLNDPEETERAFQGGWFHSGDVGYWKWMKGQKYFFIKGRLKEIIIKGGVNISPPAVENAVLAAFPGLDFCYAVGVPHRRFGEEIGIVVGGNGEELKRLEEALKKGGIWGLKPYECPAIYVTVNRDDLPKTSTGKIQRVMVKEKYADRLLGAMCAAEKEEPRKK